MTPLEQAQALLGEHYRNYVLIVQTEEEPYTFNIASSDPFATTGLLIESVKYQEAFMNTFQASDDDDFEWVDVEDDEDDDEDYEFM
jgi:hypothetical protein